MSSVEISSTAVEPVRFTWLVDGAPVTGGTPTMRMRRKSDVFSTTLDFDTELFIADASAVQPWLLLQPANETYAPGLYLWMFDLAFPSNAVHPDIYAVTFYADATLTTPLGTTEIRVGTVDTIDATATALATAQASINAIQGAGFTAGVDDLHAAHTLQATLATTGAAMTLTAPALTAIQAKILDDATPFHGASIATIAAFGAPPTAAAIGTAVWATAYGTPSINTFGWLTWRLAQWGTEIADKAIVGQLLVLRSLDLATTYASVTLRDKDGGLITPATGEPARFDP